MLCYNSMRVCIIKNLFYNLDLFHDFAEKKSQNVPIFSSDPLREYGGQDY